MSSANADRKHYTTEEIREEIGRTMDAVDKMLEEGKPLGALSKANWLCKLCLDLQFREWEDRAAAERPQRPAPTAPQRRSYQRA